MANVEFYDVKERKKVQIPEDRVRKVTFTTKNGGTRYGLKATTSDNRNLTKFVSKADWEKMKVPEDKG